jgi:type IV pilus secretin PilQ/predicted competence protein
MKRSVKILLGMCAAALLMLLAAVVYRSRGGRWATLRSFDVKPSSTEPADCQILLSLDKSCGYQIVREGSRRLVVDLAGAKTGNSLPVYHHFLTGVIKAYRAAPAQDAGEKPGIHIQIDTRTAVRFSVHSDALGLDLAIKALDTSLDALPTSNPALANALVLLLPVKRFTGPRALEIKPVELSTVLIRRLKSGRTVVLLHTSGRAEFKTARLENPARLVIDLENTSIVASRRFYIAAGSCVKDVRLAEHQQDTGSLARVVADLAGRPLVDVHSNPDGIEVDLTPNAAAFKVASIAKTQSEYEKQTLAVLMQPVKVSLDGGPQPSQVVRPKAINPVPKPTLTPKLAAKFGNQARPRHTRVQATGPRLAHEPLQFADALPVHSDWANVDSVLSTDPPSMLPAALAAMKAAQEVAGDGQQAAPPTVKSQAAAKPKTPSPYTGELISLNLKDVDLKDFFRLIHEISGLNVIVDPNVSGTVTLVLNDVPWDEALDIVLKNNGLGKQLEGNVLRIARIDTLTAEEENSTKLRKAQELAAPLVTIFRPLRFAQAIDVKTVGQAGQTAIPGVVTIIKSFAPGSVLSTRGSIVADPRNNAVIVTDVPTQIPVIESMIDKLDRKPEQISIEARIVQANADFTRQLSSVLAAAFNNKSGSTTSAAGTGSDIISVAPLQPPLPALSPAIQPLSVGNTGFGAFAITNAAARYAITAALSAAETRDQAKIISRPTIVTQNNVQGTVQQGVQIPIQTNINNTISVQYVNATLQLTVTPQVTQGGHIFLNIIVNNASVGALLSFAGPSINTQQATTQVLVPDGGTVVFGGITVTNRNRAATYVPLLGSIPIIGNLFKSNSVNTQDQELLFFVSPKILPDNS